MITQAVDPHHYVRRAREIRAQLPYILSQWGLVAKFKRWRLAQDPKTSMVILFGVLDNKYIASHTTTPFSNYFDPHLLRDLETELQVQIISSSNDGLRYDFILERGNIDALPEHIDALPEHTANHPSEDKLVVQVVISEKPAATSATEQVDPALLADSEADDLGQEDRSVGSYLKVFNEVQPAAEPHEPQTPQNPPDVVIEVKKFKTNQ